MHNVNEDIRSMGTPRILVGGIIQIFPSEAIKIKPIAKINIDLREMHMGINNTTGATH